jgi:hypothetical protein
MRLKGSVSNDSMGKAENRYMQRNSDTAGQNSLSQLYFKQLNVHTK